MEKDERGAEDKGATLVATCSPFACIACCSCCTGDDEGGAETRMERAFLKALKSGKVQAMAACAQGKGISV